MANGANLPGVLSKLDARQSALHTDIKNAQADVARAQKAVKDLEAAIARQTQDITQANHDLRIAASQPPNVRAQIEARLRTAQAQQDQSKRQLDQARGQLAVVLAAKKEDAARRSLEQARADFLIESRVLLASAHDAAVRYLLADAVLKAMRTRNIGVDAFGSLTDKQTVSDIVISLNSARDTTAEADRQEAARFHELRRLVEGVTASQSEFLGAVKDAQEQSTDLAAKRDDLKKQIAELQTAAAESEAESKKRSGVFGWIRNAASAVGDKFRDMKLSSRTSDLDATMKELDELTAVGPRRMQAAQASAKQYTDSLAKVEFGPDVPPAAVNSEDPFAAVSDRARAFFQRWLQAHPEIEKVIS